MHDELSLVKLCECAQVNDVKCEYVSEQMLKNEASTSNKHGEQGNVQYVQYITLLVYSIQYGLTDNIVRTVVQYVLVANKPISLMMVTPGSINTEPCSSCH